MMSDVELEIIDLATGESIGKFQLTLCEEKVYELDTGDYRFVATYLKTGESFYADRAIAEGENPPLQFEFTPAFTLRIESTPITGIPVTIDGASVGSTPVPKIVLIGEHVVDVPEEVEV